MNWSSKWGEPVDERSEDINPWFNKEDLNKEKYKFNSKEYLQEMPPIITGIDYGSKDQSFETAMQDGKIISQYETRSIKLGNKSIQVIVVGDLGLDFCEPGEKDEGWNIYHLPTLACFSSAVPGYIGNVGWLEAKANYSYDNQALLNWMVKVQSTCDSKTSIMWNELRRLTPLTYENSGRTAKKIIKEWCLSVKVE